MEKKKMSKSDLVRVGIYLGTGMILERTTSVVIKTVVKGFGRRYGLAWKLVSIAAAFSLADMVDRVVVRPAAKITIDVKECVKEEVIDRPEVKETLDSLRSELDKTIDLQDEINALRERVANIKAMNEELTYKVMTRRKEINNG